MGFKEKLFVIVLLALLGTATAANMFLSDKAVVHDSNLGTYVICRWATPSLDAHQWGRHWYIPSEYETASGERVRGHDINCIGERCLGGGF